jgi:hypothetical protein
MRRTIKELLIKVKQEENSSVSGMLPPRSRQAISGWNDAASIFAKKSFQSYVGGEHSNRELAEAAEKAALGSKRDDPFSQSMLLNHS